MIDLSNVIFTSTQYLETYDDAYSYPSYSDHKMFGDEPMFIPADAVLDFLSRLHQSMIESDHNENQHDGFYTVMKEVDIALSEIAHKNDSPGWTPYHQRQ